MLKKYNKLGPDLVICTHYDFDHIGSLEEIVGRYKIHIKEVWMNKTSRLIEIAQNLEISEDGISLFLPDEDAEELKVGNNGIIDYNDDDIQDILQQLKHEVAAIEALEEMGIIPKEPIAGQCELADWQEIRVIGPTKEYYETLFPEHFDLKRYLETEKTELKAGLGSTEQAEGSDDFEILDNSKRSSLTSTNLNSAIILIEAEQGKFLFPGDAGIESFHAIPEYENVLKNIYFLKVPHHGSANNLNSELIKLMKPQIAFIPGKSHVSDKVVRALKKIDSTVLITSDEGKTLVYPLD